MGRRKSTFEHLDDKTPTQIPIVESVGGYVDVKTVAETVGVPDKEAQQLMRVHMDPIIFRDKTWVLKTNLEKYLAKLESIVGMERCIDYAREHGYSVWTFTDTLRRCGYDVKRVGLYAYATREDMDDFAREWKIFGKRLARPDDLPKGYASPYELMEKYSIDLTLLNRLLSSRTVIRRVKIRKIQFAGRNFYYEDDLKRAIDYLKDLEENYYTTSQICCMNTSLTRSMVDKMIRLKRVDAIREGNKYYISKREAQRLLDSWVCYASKEKNPKTPRKSPFGEDLK